MGLLLPQPETKIISRFGQGKLYCNYVMEKDQAMQTNNIPTTTNLIAFWQLL
jgi:hypothetical protein